MATDWNVLLANAHRVRTIGNTHNIGIEWSEKAWQQIQRTCPTGQVFPNLKCLRGDFRVRSFPDFLMHGSVFELHLFCYLESFVYEYSDVRHIAKRLANLTSLTLEAELEREGDSMDMEEACGFVASFTKLETLVIPLYSFYGNTVKCLSTMGSLRTITVDPTKILASRGAHWPFENRKTMPVLFHGAFPSLQELSFGSSLACAQTFLADAHFPAPSLRSLWLRATDLDSTIINDTTPRALRDLLRLLADKFSSLEQLEIIMNPVGSYTGEDFQMLPIDFADISSITLFKSLTSFELRHAYPIKASDEDIESLASQWPTLKKFILNPYPSFTSEPTLSRRALLSFATHCPNIRELGLYIQTAATPLPPRSAFDFPIRRFARLSVLDLGYSKYDPKERSALCRFLFRLLPDGWCNFRTDMIKRNGAWEVLDEPDGFGDHSIVDILSAPEFWGTVEETLKLMAEVKEEGERMQRSELRAANGRQ